MATVICTLHMVFIGMLKAGRLGWLKHAGDRQFSSSWILHKWWSVFWRIIVPSSPRSSTPCLMVKKMKMIQSFETLVILYQSTVWEPQILYVRDISNHSCSVKFFPQPLLVVRREFPYHRWEPIYIGTNEEPLYSEELTWEGQQDKMTQVIELACN
jgi:hypothetical protein